MKTLTKIRCFIIISVLLSACSENIQINGYSKGDNDYYFKLLSIGDGTVSPIDKNIVLISAVIKTQNDSIFWDTKHDTQDGFYVFLDSEKNNDSFKSHLKKMVVGDSVSFLLKPSIIFRELFDTITPQFCKNDTVIKLDIKLTNIMSSEEYTILKTQKNNQKTKDLELFELQLIDRFLSQNFKFVKADINGIYVLNRTCTDLEKVLVGKKIKVAYQGSFLDGKPIDVSEQIIEFIYGAPDQLINGLNIVIGSLKKGESTKIIVPSRLAFGEVGSSNGSIPPYTPLVYKIKIIDIK